MKLGQELSTTFAFQGEEESNVDDYRKNSKLLGIPGRFSNRGEMHPRWIPASNVWKFWQSQECFLDITLCVDEER